MVGTQQKEIALLPDIDSMLNKRQMPGIRNDDDDDDVDCATLNPNRTVVYLRLFLVPLRPRCLFQYSD